MSSAEQPADYQALPPPGEYDQFASEQLREGGEYTMSAEETLTLDLSEAPVKTGRMTETDFGAGNRVYGEPVAVVRMGGAETFADAYIVDTRANPVVRQGKLPDGTPAPVRQIGGNSQGESIDRIGDFALVIPPQKEGDEPLIQALVPGKPLVLGRDHVGGGSRNADLLPDTVSREHCAVGVDAEGKLTVENRNPSNATTVFTPENQTADASQTEQAAPTGEVLSEERAVAALSYSDVLFDKPEEGTFARSDAIKWTRESVNGMKYAHELQSMFETYGSEKVKEYANAMNAACQKLVTDAGFDVSKYTKSMSWAFWDLAKQSYLEKHPEESTADYVDSAADSLGDPMADNEDGHRKREEIVYRHLGWEIAQQFENSYVSRMSPDSGDGRVIVPDWLQMRLDDNAGAVYDTLRNGDRNETGQHRSYVLHQIGRQATQRTVRR